MYSPTASDLCHQIAKAAHACLRDNRYRMFAAVSCSCESGVLLLQGRVSSFYLKQVAQESVARVEGVMQVVNEIGVFPEERPPPSSR